MVILINSHGSTTGYTLRPLQPQANPTTAIVKIQSTDQTLRGPPPNS